MAEGKNKVIFYRDWGVTFEKLSDEEAGKLIKHFCGYINDDNPTPPDRITELLFDPIKATLKRDLKAWEQKAERSRNNGKKGGRPRKDQNPEKPSGLKNNPEKPVSVSDSVTVSVIDNEKDSNNNNTSAPKIDAGSDATDIILAFHKFWDLYDKKVDRKRSFTAWKNIPKTEHEKIFAHVPKYVQSTPDKSKRKNPTTYLHGECWNDEIVFRTEDKQFIIPAKPSLEFLNVICKTSEQKAAARKKWAENGYRWSNKYGEFIKS